MGAATNQLIDVLEQIIAVLDADDEQYWRKWIASSRFLLLNSDYSGIEKLLSAYGGMGSFNDLVLGQSMLEGQFCWKVGTQNANDKLTVLRAKAYEFAVYIKRNHEIGKS